MGKRKRVTKWDCEAMPHLKLRLYHSRKRILKDIAEESVGVELEDALAQCFPIPERSPFEAWVLMEYHGEAYDEIGLLAHEATHVARRYFEFLGEEYPAEEEMAYVVGGVTSTLVNDHLRWRERHVS